MPTDYNGIAANTTTLPAAKLIASSTDATPIVVTTSAAHGLVTGDLVLVSDHSVNVAANGFWQVVVLTTTTLSLVGSAGSGAGAGGATGKVQSMAISPPITIPSDGDAEEAASVNVALEALADRATYLWAQMGWFMEVFAGGTLQIDAGARIYLGGKTIYRAPHRPADASTITVDTSQGDVVHVADSGGVARTVKLRTSTAPVPFDGERIIVDATSPALTPATWTVKTESSTTIIELNEGSWAEFQFESGVWRGVRYSGSVVAHAAWSP